jgi:hypothetical protein
VRKKIITLDVEVSIADKDIFLGGYFTSKASANISKNDYFLDIL